MRQRADTKKLTYRWYKGDERWEKWTGDEKKKRRSDDDYGSVGQWRDDGWETAGKRLRRLEDVRPDRDTEKRVAPSEEEEAGLPWGRRFPRSRASHRGASSPTSLTPIPVHWPVGEKKGKVYLFILVLRCVALLLAAGVDGRAKQILRNSFLRQAESACGKETRFFFSRACRLPAKAITSSILRCRLHFDGWHTAEQSFFVVHSNM